MICSIVPVGVVGIFELLQQLLGHLLRNVHVATPVEFSQVTQILCLILLALVILACEVPEGARIKTLGDNVLAFPSFGLENKFAASGFGDLYWATEEILDCRRLLRGVIVVDRNVHRIPWLWYAQPGSGLRFLL